MKYACILFIASINLFLLSSNSFFERAWARESYGGIAKKASHEEEGKRVALLFLRRLSKNPPSHIKSINLEYDVYLEHKWNIKMRMSAALNMKKAKNNHISTFNLTEPKGENLWGKFALFIYGRHTKEYKKMIESIETTILETFHFEHGRLITDGLIEILPTRKRHKNQKGFRVVFDYNEKLIKFWKDRSQKALTASEPYVDQVGPLTAFFNFLLFEQPETEISIINRQLNAQYIATPGKGSSKKVGGDTSFTSQVIKLQRNNTGKHIEYTNVVYFGSDDFFDIVYGKNIYYNFSQITARHIKAPYAAFLDGIIDKSKKRKKAKRLKRLQQKQDHLDPETFKKNLRAIEAINILSAKNVKAHLREANVVFQ
jgi:hypothetical protein